MKFDSHVLAAALCTGAVLATPVCHAVPTDPISGAVFTTNEQCLAVNANIYEAKSAVYLDGGPANNQTPGLPSNTSFYVQVTEPDGTVLGSSVYNTGSKTPLTTDANGIVVGCLQLQQIVSLPNGTLGFADTTNNGGEYKVWISTSPTFDNRLSKTDNFKVKGSTRPEDPTGTINIKKFYDADTDGLKDANEPYLTGWRVDLLGYAIQETPATYTDLPVVGGQTYTAREYQAQQSNWLATAPTPISMTPPYLNQATVSLSPATPVANVLFGNVCTGAGGGYTLGFWSNKNGQAAINQKISAGVDIFAGLRSLNLVTATGAAFDPYQHDQFRAWLLGGNAVNMSYMLSVQHAAMYLNIYANPGTPVNPNALIYAPGVPGANTAGFATITTVMNAAASALGSHPYTPAGHEQRAVLEAIKNALDMANNNRSFVKPTPCAYTFPVLTTTSVAP